MSQSREAETPSPDGGAASAGMNQGMRVLSYLITGIALYGGIGWGVDHLLGTVFLLPVGLVVGAALAMYLVIKRFGAEPALRQAQGTAAHNAADETTKKGRA